MFEISAMATQADSPHPGTGFVQQVRELAVPTPPLRWSGEANERYVILASDGLPKAIAEGEQCLQRRRLPVRPVGDLPRSRVIPIMGDTSGTCSYPTAMKPVEVLVAISGHGAASRAGRTQPCSSARVTEPSSEMRFTGSVGTPPWPAP